MLSGLLLITRHWSLPCRVSRVIWTGCAALGCSTRIPSDGHLHCLCQALRTADFRPYSPKVCSACAAATATLLQWRYLTGLEPRYAAVCCRWANLVKLVSKHGKAATWADPNLPLLLGFGCLVQVPSSSSLQSLLRETTNLNQHSQVFLLRL